MPAETDAPERPSRHTKPASDSAPARTPATSSTAPNEPSVLPAPPKLQRRPVLAALAVVLVAAGSLLAAYLVTISSDARPVVAVRADIERGDVIAQSNLVEARINGDPALATVPFDQVGSLVGKRAAVDLHAGGLISPSSVTDVVLPASGQAIVGVALTPAQRPAYPLRAGDVVRIIFTPRPQDDLPRGTPTSVKATVVSVQDVVDANQVVVDVSVPANAAATVASIVGTSRVALVLDRQP